MLSEENAAVTPGKMGTTGMMREGQTPTSGRVWKRGATEGGNDEDREMIPVRGVVVPVLESRGGGGDGGGGGGGGGGGRVCGRNDLTLDLIEAQLQYMQSTIEKILTEMDGLQADIRRIKD